MINISVGPPFIPKNAKMSIKPTSGHPRVVSQGYLGNTNPIQKSTLTHLLNLSSDFQNGITQPSSINNHRVDAFLVNGIFGGQAEAVQP